MYLLSRVKSLSKGNSSKKDPLSALNPRDSTAFPLPSVLPTASAYEDNITDVSNERNRSGWTRQTEREICPPSVRSEGNLVASLNSDYNVTEGRFVYHLETHGQGYPSWVKLKTENQETCKIPALDDNTKSSASLTEQRDVADFKAEDSDSDNDLNALLKVMTVLYLIGYEFKLVIPILICRKSRCLALGRGRTCNCTPASSGGINRNG